MRPAIRCPDQPITERREMPDDNPRLECGSPFAAKVLSILHADAAPNTPVAPGGQNFTSTPAILTM